MLGKRSESWEDTVPAALPIMRVLRGGSGEKRSGINAISDLRQRVRTVVERGHDYPLQKKGQGQNIPDVSRAKVLENS
jgi:hypothetical protein